jgi:hypothetical protein
LAAGGGPVVRGDDVVPFLAIPDLARMGARLSVR